MALNDAYILAFLVTRLTIQKSKYYLSLLIKHSHKRRALIATIRDMGDCPCPQCTIKKTDIGNVLSKADIRARQRLVRKDDRIRRDKIDKARDIIYTHGYAVNSERVEELLKDESWVPTKVRVSLNLSNH